MRSGNVTLAESLGCFPGGFKRFPSEGREAGMNSAFSPCRFIRPQEGRLHESRLHFLLDLLNIAHIQRPEAYLRKIHTLINPRINTLDSYDELSGFNVNLVIPESCKKRPVHCFTGFVCQSG